MCLDGIPRRQPPQAGPGVHLSSRPPSAWTPRAPLPVTHPGATAMVARTDSSKEGDDGHSQGAGDCNRAGRRRVSGRRPPGTGPGGHGRGRSPEAPGGPHLDRCGKDPVRVPRRGLLSASPEGARVRQGPGPHRSGSGQPSPRSRAAFREGTRSLRPQGRLVPSRIPQGAVGLHRTGAWHPAGSMGFALQVRLGTPTTGASAASPMGQALPSMVSGHKPGQLRVSPRLRAA